MDKNMKRKRNKKTAVKQSNVVQGIDPRDKDMFRKGAWLNIGSNLTGAKYRVLIGEIKKLV